MSKFQWNANKKKRNTFILNENVTANKRGREQNKSKQDGAHEPECEHVTFANANGQCWELNIQNIPKRTTGTYKFTSCIFWHKVALTSNCVD